LPSLVGTTRDAWSAALLTPHRYRIVVRAGCRESRGGAKHDTNNGANDMKTRHYGMAAAVAAACIGLLLACGGGSSSSSSSSGAPATASGVLSAFGSVVVNGH
jgi:hypothetical protein